MIHLYHICITFVAPQKAEKRNKNTGSRIQMKLYHVASAFLPVAVFCTPVFAQEGLEDGERIARLEGAYEHLATKVDVEGVRTELVALRSEVHAAAQTTQVIFAVIAGFLSLVLGGAQVWIGFMLRETKRNARDD